MTRDRRNTQHLTLRIDIDLVDELKSTNPSLVTRSTKKEGELKFRHGALGRYISRLIREDIERLKKLQQDDLLKKFT